MRDKYYDYVPCIDAQDLPYYDNPRMKMRYDKSYMVCYASIELQCKRYILFKRLYISQYISLYTLKDE